MTYVQRTYTCLHLNISNLASRQNKYPCGLPPHDLPELSWMLRESIGLKLQGNIQFQSWLTKAGERHKPRVIQSFINRKIECHPAYECFPVSITVGIHSWFSPVIVRATLLTIINSFFFYQKLLKHSHKIMLYSIFSEILHCFLKTFSTKAGITVLNTL